MADRHNSVARHIEAPPETVWDLLADSSSYGGWNPAVISITGRIAVGEKLELVSVVNPKRSFKLEVMTMEPPTTMTWADGMPLGLFKGVRTYHLTPKDGGTDFTMTEEFSGPLAGLIIKSIPDLKASFDAFADGLKSGAEARNLPSG